MGNTRLYGFSAPAPADGLIEEVFESSLASDLQTRVQAYYATLVQVGRGLVDFNLAGAGDGHSFMCTLVSAPVRASDPNLEFRFYLAASERELRAAAAALIASLQSPPVRYIYGQSEAGSKQGTRWMGVFLVSITD